MDTTPYSTAGVRRRPLLAAVAAAVGTAAVPLAAGTAHASTSSSRPKPTVVLVHGAFADASGWAAVTANLLDDGYTVLAPANPLRGLIADSEYLKALLATITGPVVLVGHSYGGAVVTNAATGNPNIKALVYIAAYALDEGESAAGANALGGGSTDLVNHLQLRPYPGAPDGDGDASIDPAYFRTIFAQDLPASRTAVMATAQRPVALFGLLAPSGVPAWKTIPSWYLVAGADHAIPPEAERAMAARANAHTVEARGSSHAAMISQPGAVTNLILAAACR